MCQTIKAHTIVLKVQDNADSIVNAALPHGRMIANNASIARMLFIVNPYLIAFLSLPVMLMRR
jgi:hypothetical protein